MSRVSVKAERFLALLQPLRRPLEVYCRRMLRDRSLVEDVLQSAVLEAFAGFDRYTEGTNFRAWMFRFVTLEIFNRNRKRAPVCWADSPVEVADTVREGPADVDGLASLLEDRPEVLEQFDDTVAGALQGLPAAERAVLLLRSIGEFSYQEIHELLSIPVGSVTGYLSRARQKLRQALAGYAAGRGLGRRPLSGEART